MASNDPDLANLIAALLSPNSNFMPTPPPTVQSALAMSLSDLFKGTPPPPKATGVLSRFANPTPNALSGLFGRAGSLPPAASVGSKVIGGPVAPVSQPKQRHTFYSFHYADVFRVNHVRNSGRIRDEDKGLRPRDKSLWESVRRTDPANLRRVINAGLQSTTVTCVLAGEETYAREWVRYEIAKSLQRGNGLLTVYIDGCQCPRNGFAPRGPDPLACMALGWDQCIYEYRNHGWYPYDKIPTRIPNWPRWLAKPDYGRVMQLSSGTNAYDWINDNGRLNLIRWTCQAARAAGR